MRWNKDLVGAKDGANTSYTIPDTSFIQSGEIVVRVYRNGRRMRFGALNDYTVSESGGAGTGYDTIVFNGPAPLSYEVLTADYMVDE